MTTITINTYDPAGRFDMTEWQAQKFYALIEKRAKEKEYATEFDNAISVDEFSEAFVSSVFDNLYDGDLD